MRKTYPLVLLTCFVGLSASAQSFEFSFWSSARAARDPRVVRIEEHPCGTVAIANVSVIPRYKQDGVLIPERVLEVSASGNIIRRWWLPTDSRIQGITGDTLTIEHASKTYAVRPGGKVRYLKPASDSPAEDERPSCNVPSELLPSDYAVCQVFKDTKSKFPRKLAYETVCT
jgi:hypothetical protein